MVRGTVSGTDEDNSENAGNMFGIYEEEIHSGSPLFTVILNNFLDKIYIYI